MTITHFYVAATIIGAVLWFLALQWVFEAHIAYPDPLIDRGSVNTSWCPAYHRCNAIGFK